MPNDFQTYGPWDPRGFDRTVLDARELRDYLPALWLFFYAYLLGVTSGLALLNSLGLLNVAFWQALVIPIGFWISVIVFRRRGEPSPRRLHGYVAFGGAISAVLLVPIVQEPASTFMVFVVLPFMAHSIFVLTPRHALRLLGLVLFGVLGVRIAQMVFGADADLASYPVNVAAMLGVVWILTVTYGVLWTIAYAVWGQKRRERASQEEVERAFQDLKAIERARSEFLSSVTHDLKTPLVTIHGYLDLALRNGIDPALAQGLRVAKRNATRLQRLIEDVLSTSDAQATQSRLRFEDIPTRLILEEEMATFENQAAARGIRLSLACSDDQSIWIDRQRIGRVISNLVDNALKFSSAGGTVEIGARAFSPTEALIWVRDEGPGISPDVIQHLFETHYMLAREDRPRAGMGIGLTISQRLVVAMGGRISVESAQGRGTTFNLVFPVRAVALPPASGVPPVRKALVLDDESDVLELMAYHLRAGGFEPVLIQNGTAAYEKAMQEDFELILLDVNVPGLTGVEVSRRLRDAGRPGRILLFSALIRNDAERLLLEARADGFLPKPFNTEQIEEILGDLRITRP
jgi:signal transduction histidine kinase/CheY-like chemotaxis protein